MEVTGAVGGVAVGGDRDGRTTPRRVLSDIERQIFDALEKNAEYLDSMTGDYRSKDRKKIN